MYISMYVDRHKHLQAAVEVAKGSDSLEDRLVIFHEEHLRQQGLAENKETQEKKRLRTQPLLLLPGCAIDKCHLRNSKRSLLQ